MATMRTGSPNADSSSGSSALDTYAWNLSPEKLAVAESTEQDFAIQTLRSSLRELARQRRWASEEVFIGSHTFFAWLRDDPLLRLAPDVYLLDHPPDPLPRSWQTWLPGYRPPRWAAEVVSTDWGKDYLKAPARYAALGCRELVLFDPEVVAGRTRASEARAALSVFRRDAGGGLARVYFGPGPAWSEPLRCWLHPRREGYWPALRLAKDKAGKAIVPTTEERASRSERRAASADKRAKSAESRAKSAEARAKSAEARAKKLEEELRQRKGK